MPARLPGIAVVLAVIVGVGALMAMMQPAIGWDPWRGVVASEQKLADPSQSLATVVVASPADVNREWRERIEWWPPGPQILIYGMRRAGLSLGACVKILVLASWMIGVVAWSGYFLVALGRRPLAAVAIILCVLHRASHASGFSYAGGETILWALFPVAALLYLWAGRSRRPQSIVFWWLSGVAAGGLVLFKYSAAILIVGFAIDALIRVLRKRATAMTLIAWILGCAMGLSIRLIAVPHVWPTDTPAAATVHPHVTSVLAWTVAGPLMALGDVYDIAGTLRRTRSLDFTLGSVITPLSLLAIVAFGLWWVTSRSARAGPTAGRPSAPDARDLATIITVTTSVALTILMLRGGSISFEGRHQQYGAFLLFPFFAAAVVRSLQPAARPIGRAAGAACVLAFFLVPAAYGIVTLVYQSVVLMPRVSSGIGPTGVRLDWAAAGAGARAFAQEIRSLPEFSRSLLVTGSPDVALTFTEKRGRVVLSGGVDDPRRYHGRPDGGALLIDPPGATDAELRTIKSSFLDIATWTRIPIASVPGAQVWRGQ